jgi:glucokinase
MSDIQQLPYLLFDIGGSNTRLGYSVDGSTIKDTRIFKTPKTFEEGIVAIAQTAREMVGDEKPVIAAGGVAGVLSLDKTKIIHSPHLPGWNEKNLASELSLAFGTRVFLENDTALVGLGESFYGAAQNHKIVVYITISTGVNGVRLTNNQIDPSQYGFEVGHQIVDFDRSSGKLTLEDLIGGASIERRYGKAPQDIDDPSFWEEMARLTSVGVANMILHWSPEIVVIGGSVLKKLSLERIKMNLKSMLTIYPEIPVIAKASLGDLGGVWGALHFLNTKKEDA